MESLSVRVEGLVRKFRRVRFYAQAVAREVIPQSEYRRRLTQFYATIWKRDDLNELLVRVNYYNKFDEASTIAIPKSVKPSFNDTYYYFDLRRITNFFDRQLLVDFRFGDVFWIPDTPQIVKSRPIHGDNRNAILMRLDSLRHFSNWPKDHRPFRTKASRAVWRGNLNNPLREVLVGRHGNSAVHDIGHTSK